MTFRILGTGSREFSDVDLAYDAMSEAWWLSPDITPTFVHGGARGADEIMATFAAGYGWHIEEHKADWENFGRGAGPMRNQAMVHLGADVVVALFVDGLKCAGTHDLVNRAEMAGIPVSKYYQSRKVMS